MRLALTMIAFVLFVGCAHNIETRELDPETLAFKSDKGIKGVVYYAPAYVRVTHSFSARVDGTGQVIAGECVPVVSKEEIQIMPDLFRPLAILNKPSAFSGGKLTVSLSNGMLQSVNTEAHAIPGELIKAVAAAVPLAAAADVPPGEKLACNAAPIITGFKRMSLEEEN